MNETVTADTSDLPPPGASRGLALVVAWSRDEPGRVGERMLLAPGTTRVVGRGPSQTTDPAPRVWPVRLRPGRAADRGLLASPRLSRVQLVIDARADHLVVRNVGKGGMRHDGQPRDEAVVRPGGVLWLDGRLVLVCVESPLALPEQAELVPHPFGTADAHGIVGESEAAWQLRKEVAFCGPRAAHVLVLGPSGSGKELVARALHALSGRRRGPWVDRNAATLPEGLVDAELFGHARNYPNPGTPERTGLVGAADGGTLFLDEFAELPPGLQAHLLRVLDEGSYQRLGEAASRRADLRLVAATNRGEGALKHDVLARFKLRITVPGLDRRPDDVGLLVRHLLRRILAVEPDLAARFAADGEPRVGASLVIAALSRRWTTHVRELEALLWTALAASPGDTVEAPTEAAPEPVPEAVAADWTAWVGQPAADLPAAAIQACLDAHNGNQEAVWPALGLDSRYVLRRLIKRHKLVVRRQG